MRRIMVSSTLLEYGMRGGKVPVWSKHVRKPRICPGLVSVLRISNFQSFDLHCVAIREMKIVAGVSRRRPLQQWF